MAFGWFLPWHAKIYEITISTAHKITNVPWLRLAFLAALTILTLPYRRTFKLYTWRPIRAMCAARGQRNILIPLAQQWKEEKYGEMGSVQVSASFCAGAVLATIPWARKESSPWVAEALWITSLMCSVWAIISTVQVKSILNDLPDKADLKISLPDAELERLTRTVLRYRRTPRFQHWAMVFVWQFPSMTMAYSWVTFLCGLTIYMCDPFIRSMPWQGKHKIAIVYLVVGSFGLATYMLTAILVYIGEKDRERYTFETQEGKSDLESGRPGSSSDDPIDAQTHRSAHEQTKRPVENRLELHLDGAERFKRETMRSLFS